MSQIAVSVPEAFDPICRDLLSRRKEGAVVLLSGVLGAGKTTFVRRFALALETTDVASPSFGVMHEYAPNLRHFDLYRVGSEAFFARGLQETLDSGWNFIEWADKKIEDYLKNNAIAYVKINIELKDNLRLVSVGDE
ncbi:MAG: tRNA (adenosine(37)-N6)-threonylcarbamoyltransferase complex ATPase subunit type 1 TsaE [Helicobacteraceae bacterium]|jgi:tRNA threonylcarbamoyladenosine biosynthesis protein TsaE|nr:tRNA (adenosine(37)-N6)-threonylcarbamoyltransferase complex ATPase subunit type 1 TsaE [Helicobacteraceae bacterium]